MVNWTDDEDKYILENLDKPASQLAEYLSKTRNAVLGRLYRLGVSKKKEIVEIKPPEKTREGLRHPIYTKYLRDALPNDCRYTQETGAQARICGNNAGKDGYCDSCRIIAKTASQMNLGRYEYVARKDYSEGVA